MGASIVHDAFENIIGTEYIQNIVSFFKVLLDGLHTYLTGNNLATTLDIFRAVGASLMIIFFFIAISDCIQKDLLSFDKFIVFMIRLFVGFMVIYYLPEMIAGFFELSVAIYETVVEGDMGVDNLPIPSEESFEEALGWKGNIIKVFAKNLGSIISFLIINLIGWIGKFMIMMFALSNALMLMARIIFAPLGVAQCFDEGSRSAGIRYLKLLLADMLTYAAIIGLLWAASKLSSAILLGVYNNLEGVIQASKMSEIPIAEPDILDKLVHDTMFIGTAFAIRLAVIGGIAKANQLAKEVVGV